MVDRQIGVRVSPETYAAIEKEAEELRKETGIKVTVSAVVRGALEQRYQKKGARRPR